MKKEIKNVLLKKYKPGCAYLIRHFAETIDAMIEQKSIFRGQLLYKDARYMYSAVNHLIYDSKYGKYMDCRKIMARYGKSR